MVLRRDEPWGWRQGCLLLKPPSLVHPSTARVSPLLKYSSVQHLCTVGVSSKLRQGACKWKHLSTNRRHGLHLVTQFDEARDCCTGRWQGYTRQVALEIQDLPCMHLSHHELESIFLVTIIVIIVICVGAAHSM